MGFTSMKKMFSNYFFRKKENGVMNNENNKSSVKETVCYTNRELSWLQFNERDKKGKE